MDERYRNRLENNYYRGAGKRRRRTKILRIIAVIAAIVLVIGIVAFLTVVLKNRFGKIDGVYERNVDVTSEVTVSLLEWLSDVDDAEIDSDWVKERVGNYYIKERLTLSEEKDGVASYKREIDDMSYTQLVEVVNADTENMLSEIISKKLIDKGYADNVSSEEAAALAQEVLGMSIHEYLESNMVSVAPDLVSIKKEVLGTSEAQTGTYSISKNVMTISVEGADATETVIKKDGILAFSESGRVYQEK